VEILKFFWGHFEDLKLLDFILITILTACAAYGIWSFIDNLFEKKFQAQQDLLKLKEETISVYRYNMELIATEKRLIAERLTDVHAEYIALKGIYFETHKGKEALEDLTRILFTSMNRLNRAARNLIHMCLVQRRHLAVMNLLVIYSAVKINERFPESPDTKELYHHLEAVQETMNSIAEEAFQWFVNIDTEQTNAVPPLPTSLVTFDHNIPWAELDKVSEAIDQYLSPFFTGRESPKTPPSLPDSPSIT
jgi:hypothetical protein